MAAAFFESYPEKPGITELADKEDLGAWYHNGRDKTFKEFYSLDCQERRAVSEYLKSLPLREIITVNGREIQSNKELTASLK